MPSLSYLSVSNNNFQGSISSILSNLCNLQHLNFAHSNFTDDLTDIIQTLAGCANKTLLKLHLGYNKLHGSIPDMIGSFSSLTELYLNDNQLNGNISSGTGKLLMLEEFYVSSNSLRGTLTSEHFSSLSRLREFDSSNNPRLVFNIRENWLPPFQLEILGLRSCQLGPGFPEWIRTQTKLLNLDISNAQVSGEVSKSFWDSLSSNLKYLNMSHNRLHGSHPITNMTFPHLSILDLSSNFLEGALPSSFPYPDLLYLNNNRFNDSLRFLCPNIKVHMELLDLSDNLLSGELPDCWLKFDQLIDLHLENNSFSGNLPNSIFMIELQCLHLYNNSFSGSLPVTLGNSTSLVILNLGYNSLTGHIPPSIGKAFRYLGALRLRRNKFVGEIPLSICQLENLQILDLALNHISGLIPKCIQNLTALQDSHDHSQEWRLHDLDPRGIHERSEERTIISWKREEQLFKASIGFIKSFHLSHNELHGEIPHEISLLRGLVSLDVSGNKLTGSITSGIGNLTTLELLDLSNNQLTGEIPESLAQIASLGILNLSNNHLSGQIPHGTQLQGFNVSSYAGNPGLCGVPLLSCSPSIVNGNNVTVLQHDHDGIFPGLYITIVFGLIVGFWGVCGTLVLKTSWRHAYFNCVDDIRDKIYVVFILNIAKIWRKP